MRCEEGVMSFYSLARDVQFPILSGSSVLCPGE